MALFLLFPGERNYKCSLESSWKWAKQNLELWVTANGLCPLGESSPKCSNCSSGQPMAPFLTADKQKYIVFLRNVSIMFLAFLKHYCASKGKKHLPWQDHFQCFLPFNLGSHVYRSISHDYILVCAIFCSNLLVYFATSCFSVPFIHLVIQQACIKVHIRIQALFQVPQIRSQIKARSLPLKILS